MWARGFRPFFALASLYGALAPLAFVAFVLGFAPAPASIPIVSWHGHEMVFGFAAAGIAGFLLTAVPNWTGLAPVVGARLATLTALWVLGRVAMWSGSLLPGPIVALADAAFTVALAVALAESLLAPEQRRNRVVLFSVAGLAGANLGFHASALGWIPLSPSAWLRAGVGAIVVLLVVIGGRITPAFTQNALLRERRQASVDARPEFSRAAMIAATIFALASLVPGAGLVRGVAAAVAGVCVWIALAGWRAEHTLGEPLLWSLHLGRAWLGAGLVAVAAAAAGWIPDTASLHFLTAGAIGTTILGVMMRVTLGHTGRPLEALPGSGVALGLVSLGALLRIAAGYTGSSLWLPAALAFGAGFAFFAFRYGPFLLTPRPDGRPG